MTVCLRVSGSRIGTEEAFYLYTSGPDLTSIMPCKYGKPSGTFSKFVTEEALKCEHVRDLLMKNKDVDTTALVVSLVSVLLKVTVIHVLCKHSECLLCLIYSFISGCMSKKFQFLFINDPA